MNLAKVYALTALFSVFTFVPATRATAITAPPLETQVKQVAQWFTGLFDNSQQVATNPSVPLITMLLVVTPTRHQVLLRSTQETVKKVGFRSSTQPTSTPLKNCISYHFF